MMGKNSYYASSDDSIEISQSFELGIHLVTQGLWQAVMGSSWSEASFIGSDRPVENVSWNDICGRDGFLEKLNVLLLSDPQAHSIGSFSLPTEAQWQYAVRGGRYQKQIELFYAGSNRINEVAWYQDNSENETHPVGQKNSNQLGLFDMSGNVSEWVEGDSDYELMHLSNEEVAGFSAFQNIGRHYLGGSWAFNSEHCLTLTRGLGLPEGRSSNIGFRLARRLGY